MKEKMMRAIANTTRNWAKMMGQGDNDGRVWDRTTQIMMGDGAYYHVMALRKLYTRWN
jgi:hypothetical protein